MTGTIFITGATSGFGLATARRFAREGWKVAATYHRDEMAKYYFAADARLERYPAELV